MLAFSSISSFGLSSFVSTSTMVSSGWSVSTVEAEFQGLYLESV